MPILIIFSVIGCVVFGIPHHRSIVSAHWGDDGALIRGK
jgi:hypothetical protein